MIELGKKQELTVIKRVEFGVYLGEQEDAEERVLLPKKQVPEGTEIGSKLTVFVYKDSKDRLISTTNEPKLELGGLAVLKVAQVGKIGAFLDWGLEKDLLLPFRKVADNVALPLELAGTDRKTARAEAMRYFEQFGLQGTEERYPAQLSGGMRQRAALLRTYLFGKSVALLDEPFSALDTITKSAIHRWYLDVMEQIHLSTLFITHDIDEAILLSDRIYILSGRPGHITDEIHINVPKPRAGDFTLTPEFLAYKRQIIEAMHLS